MNAPAFTYEPWEDLYLSADPALREQAIEMLLSFTPSEQAVMLRLLAWRHRRSQVHPNTEPDPLVVAAGGRARLGIVTYDYDREEKPCRMHAGAAWSRIDPWAWRRLLPDAQSAAEQALLDAAASGIAGEVLILLHHQTDGSTRCTWRSRS